MEFARQRLAVMSTATMAVRSSEPAGVWFGWVGTPCGLAAVPKSPSCQKRALRRLAVHGPDRKRTRGGATKRPIHRAASDPYGSEQPNAVGAGLVSRCCSHLEYRFNREARRHPIQTLAELRCCEWAVFRRIGVLPIVNLRMARAYDALRDCRRVRNVVV